MMHTWWWWWCNWWWWQGYKPWGYWMTPPGWASPLSSQSSHHFQLWLLQRAAWSLGAYAGVWSLEVSLPQCLGCSDWPHCPDPPRLSLLSQPDPQDAMTLGGKKEVLHGKHILYCGVLSCSVVQCSLMPVSPTHHPATCHLFLSHCLYLAAHQQL